ncbi:MAG: hypothetical protein WCW02_02645 [Candidatus Buchananbacteria bacterium]
MLKTCPELAVKLEAIKVLKSQLNQELSNLPPSGKLEDLVMLEKIKEKLGSELKDLQNEAWFGLPEFSEEYFENQYDIQRDILIENGLLKFLSTGEFGIHAIDGLEYPMPTLEQVKEGLLKNRELLKTKIKQGFVELVMVPFGLPAALLDKVYREKVVKINEKKELLATDKQRIELKDEFFTDHDTRYLEGDSEGFLFYHPQNFFEGNNPDKAKPELLATQAWQALLFKNSSEFPYTGQVVFGRKEFEIGKNPIEYLKQLQTDPQYQGEQGLTPESWLTYALSNLEQKNQIVDNYYGYHLLDCYFVIQNQLYTPGYYQAQLYWNHPATNNPNFSVRTAVKVI